MTRTLTKQSFFARPATTVAPELLGWTLVHDTPEGKTSGIIVETEAYMGADDAASHAFRGPTPRTQVMFGPAGYAYIYFTYGMHYCINVVTGKAGGASAVLIRALEPVEGIELMHARRGIENLTQLTSGPGKLTQALALNKAQNGHDFLTPPLQLLPSTKPVKFEISPRIGIRHAADKPWRFYIKDSPYVSRRSAKN